MAFSGEIVSGASTERGTIVVVAPSTEEKQALREQLKFLLGETPVITFNNGPGLLEYLSHSYNNNPRLIFLDAASGEERTLDALRANSALRDVPVILISDGEEKNEALPTFGDSAQVSVSKPITRRDVLEILNNRAGPAPDMVST